MAIGRGIKRKYQEDDGYLSDESSFYGDETMKQDFEDRASEFDAQDWWKHKKPSLLEIAESNLKVISESKPAALHNPYEGRLSARQLNESVDEFLKRLPPATTSVANGFDWIWIANPYLEAPKPGQIKYEVGKNVDEGPPSRGDWPTFVVQAGKLLEILTSTWHQVEKENVGKTKPNYWEEIQPTESRNCEAAVRYRSRVTLYNGQGMPKPQLPHIIRESYLRVSKWMFFCPPEEINAIWAVIARGTAANELGVAAKVAPDAGDDRTFRLICVYTKDFSDMKDVTRVANKLKEYGLIETRGKPIYYKCDAYTWLNLSRDNEHGIKPSMYSSMDVLSAKPDLFKNRQIDTLFTKRGKERG